MVKLQRVRVPCSPTVLNFTTVAGTPIPRFTVSASISSSICSLSGSPQFRLSLTIILLEKRPVTVCPSLDDKVDLWPKDSLFRWRKSVFKDLIKFTDGDDTGADMRRQEAQPDPFPSKEFPPGHSFGQFGILATILSIKKTSVILNTVKFTACSLGLKASMSGTTASSLTFGMESNG